MGKYTGIHIGFDTSNYKTSLCAVDESGNIISDRRILLKVKDKSKGMRQSEAVFNHVKNLPRLMDMLIDDLNFKFDHKWNVESIGVSDRPRPQKNSYMPVFSAGTNFASIYKNGLESGGKYPLFNVFSHQEGHIEAVKFHSDIFDVKKFIAFHFSGGTTETLIVDEDNGNRKIKPIGGSLDISFGQLIDRIGVAMDISFPCGEEMDEMALQYFDNIKDDGEKLKSAQNLLPHIKFSEGYFNLSGIETAALRKVGYVDNECLAFAVLYNIGKVIRKTIVHFHEKYHINAFLFSGGVSSSRFIKNLLRDVFYKKDNIHLVFGTQQLSQDNSIGIALLSMKKYNSEKTFI